MKRDVRPSLFGASVWAALLLPGAVIFHLEPTPPVSCGPDCAQLRRNFNFGISGYRMYFLVATPLFISLTTSLVIVIHVRSGSEVAPSLAWLLAIIVQSGAVQDTVTFLASVLAVPTGVLFSTVFNNLATSKRTAVPSC